MGDRKQPTPPPPAAAKPDPPAAPPAYRLELGVLGYGSVAIDASCEDLDGTLARVLAQADDSASAPPVAKEVAKIIWDVSRGVTGPEIQLRAKKVLQRMADEG